jgi:hypothetical protein
VAATAAATRAAGGLLWRQCGPTAAAAAPVIVVQGCVVLHGGTHACSALLTSLCVCRPRSAGCLRAGALLLAAGAAPLALSCFRIAARLDGRTSGVTTAAAICAPNVAGWALLCACAALVHAAMRQNHAWQQRCLFSAASDDGAAAADGAPTLLLPVWHGVDGAGVRVAAARAAAATALAAAQARRLSAGSAAWVDSLSDEAIAALAARLAGGKAPPRALRVRAAAAHLYCRATAEEEAAAAAAHTEEAGVRGAPASFDADDADDSLLCFICCDRPHGAVLLGCGHGGLCGVCAARVWLRPPSECPACRADVDQVVLLTDAGHGAPPPPDGALVRVRGLERVTRGSALAARGALGAALDAAVARPRRYSALLEQSAAAALVQVDILVPPGAPPPPRE